MGIIDRVIKSAIYRMGYTGLFNLAETDSALYRLGWFKSYSESRSVDLDNNPIPWITYPAIFFIEESLKKTSRKLSVFEYGSGASTIWWAKRVEEIVSVEHDKEWFEKVKGMVPANSKVTFKELDKGYAGEISNTGKTFDIVIVDGRNRNECALTSVKNLKPDGIIIWDNSDRESYKSGIESLLAQGFKRIPFRGMVPMNNALNETSIFYRDENLFNI